MKSWGGATPLLVATAAALLSPSSSSSSQCCSAFVVIVAPSSSASSAQRRRTMESASALPALASDDAELLTVEGGRQSAGGGGISRRAALLSAAAAAAAATLGGAALPAFADGDGIVLPPPEVELKSFVDPEGLFLLNVPKRFYTIRRKAKGDLPDEKTGKGRRGSSIFTAGDLAKAEVIAVERFPTTALLEESGIAAVGDLSSFPALGKPSAVAELVNARREREKQQGAGGAASRTALIPGSTALADDGKTLTFTLRTKIDVQKPDLLLEQQGVSELNRITLGRCTLDSGDGNIMAVFASAMETDYNGPDGEALRKTVESFRALDRSGK